MPENHFKAVRISIVVFEVVKKKLKKNAFFLLSMRFITLVGSTFVVLPACRIFGAHLVKNKTKKNHTSPLKCIENCAKTHKQMYPCCVFESHDLRKTHHKHWKITAKNCARFLASYYQQNYNPIFGRYISACLYDYRYSSHSVTRIQYFPHSLFAPLLTSFVLIRRAQSFLTISFTFCSWRNWRRSFQRYKFHWLSGGFLEWSKDGRNHSDWRNRRQRWGKCCKLLEGAQLCKSECSALNPLLVCHLPMCGNECIV